MSTSSKNQKSKFFFQKKVSTFELKKLLQLKAPLVSRFFYDRNFIHNIESFYSAVKSFKINTFLKLKSFTVLTSLLRSIEKRREELCIQESFSFFFFFFFIFLNSMQNQLLPIFIRDSIVLAPFQL